MRDAGTRTHVSTCDGPTGRGILDSFGRHSSAVGQLPTRQGKMELQNLAVRLAWVSRGPICAGIKELL